MKTIGNVLWFVFVGVWTWIGWAIFGLIACITVVGIPIGKQCFKMGRFALWPFGRTTVKNGTSVSTLANALWFVPGVLLALANIIGGLLLCITVVGIPFGLQAFKMATLSFSPFGRDIVRTKDLHAGYVAMANAAPVQVIPPPPTA